MKTKYTSFNNGIFKDLKDPNELALFIYLYSGKYEGVEKDKLASVIGMSKTGFAKSIKKLKDLGYVIETDKAYIATDDPDPMHNHTNAEPNLFNEAHPLIEWLNKKCPRVQRMQQPLTDKEATKLIEDFEKVDIKDIFTAMNNTVSATTKNVSANQTCRNWLNRRGAPSKTTNQNTIYNGSN